MIEEPDNGPVSLPRATVRWLPGAPLFLGCAFLAFALMANQSRVPGGVALGGLLCIVAAFGLLDWLGALEPAPGMPVQHASKALGRRLVLAIVGAVAFVMVTRAAVAGTLPYAKWTAALAIPGTLLATVAMSYEVLAALGVFDESRQRLVTHPSFFLIALTVLVYAPMLGSFSLIDPWETHYGEVAREILARDDWISLWWAQDGWFWSKPILDFWLQALSFSLFDVAYLPDRMIAAVASGRTPYPEWAVRLPILLYSLVGQVLLYAGVRRCWGARAAWLGSVVLLAVPHYAIIAHQSMTDLPYIATLMGAMGLFLLGFSCPQERTVRGYAVMLGKRRVVISAHTLVVGAVVVCALPQILYLLSRNLGLVTTGGDFGFFAHLDHFFAGSGGGNCGLPGNQNCSSQFPANASPQPAASALFWAIVLGVFLLSERAERRQQRLYFIGAWLFVAQSFMAKGLPGPVIAIATFVAAVAFMRRWHEFERFELPSAVLVFACVALPWFVQMTVRHGPAFLDRLFIHDMYKRAFVHVHDTNAGDDTSIHYYLWQLGYGLFPATGVVALTSLWGFWGRGEHKDRAQAAASFLSTWFLAGFAMFTLTLTKFHHYVIAVVPPICLLSGRVLGHLLGRPTAFDWRKPMAWLWPPTETGQCRRESRALRWLLVVAASTMTWFIGVDLFSPNAPNGPVRLINLVTYNYSRPWPQHLVMTTAVESFAVATIVAMLGWLGPARIHRTATVSFLAVCVGFSAWICNVYLPRVAPHWGQRDTIAEYYRQRRSPDEPLVSYQMNWKGENFYTGNRTPTFITTGETFKRFVLDQRTARRRVLFFTLEPSRLGNLKNDLGPVARVEVLTNAKLNNKFSLVRVEL